MSDYIQGPSGTEARQGANHNTYLNEVYDEIERSGENSLAELLERRLKGETNPERAERLYIRCIAKNGPMNDCTGLTRIFRQYLNTVHIGKGRLEKSLTWKAFWKSFNNITDEAVMTVRNGLKERPDALSVARVKIGKAWDLYLNGMTYGSVDIGSEKLVNSGIASLKGLTLGVMRKSVEQEILEQLA